MAHYLCINAERHGIQVHGSLIANSVEEAIEQWVDPAIGYVPEHMDNTFEDMASDDKLTEEQIEAYNDENHPKCEEVDAIVKKEAIKRTTYNFGLGPLRETWTESERRQIGGDGYGYAWAIIEIDDEGNTKTYPDI